MRIPTNRNLVSRGAKIAQVQHIAKTKNWPTSNVEKAECGRTGEWRNLYIALPICGKCKTAVNRRTMGGARRNFDETDEPVTDDNELPGMWERADYE